MESYFDSTNRGPGEFVLFAVAFVGFLIAAAGVIVSSPPIAFIGAIILVLSVAAFGWRQSAGAP